MRNILAVWALLFCIPFASLALNSEPAAMDAQDNDTNIVMNTDVNADLMTTASDELNLEEGATDEWRRRRWGRGWYGRGYYGWGYPYYGYGYGYPYSVWPYYGYSRYWW